MIVYDITDLESFNNLNTWLIEIEKYNHYNIEMPQRTFIRYLSVIKAISHLRER
jgi:hypothetical protein